MEKDEFFLKRIRELANLSWQRDIVTFSDFLKKVHPCGSRDWEILRVGADFRLKCTGCGHQIMVPRKMVEKNTKNLIKKEK